ncbi:hypothetical protein GGR57DRAFT_503224 [Xylariaceae sp. FL1272]|nr:hypothetical protein GGR57DRAFT_503224 [Xylariaceae sp. FL1272]
MNPDQELRIALIRTKLVLLQREVREKSNWYTSPRIIVRKRNGKVQLSRRGSHYIDNSQKKVREASPFSFVTISEPLTPVSVIGYLD